MDNNLRPFCHREPEGIIDIFSLTDYSSIPKNPGAYIFVSYDQKFLYPNGSSKIIYIGKAENLRQRIQTHKRIITEVSNLKKSDKNSYWYFARYQYLAKFGGKLYYFTRKGSQEAKNLENLLLEEFYDRYLSLPVGNGARSFRS